jgi:hypothetical protein
MPPTVLQSLGWLTAGLLGVATAVATSAPRDASAPATAAAVAPAPHAAPLATENADNPRVPPGLVKWHASFAAARAAAQESGKPVLLFHMMGQLDRQFC